MRRTILAKRNPSSESLPEHGEMSSESIAERRSKVREMIRFMSILMEDFQGCFQSIRSEIGRISEDPTSDSIAAEILAIFRQDFAFRWMLNSEVSRYALEVANSEASDPRLVFLPASQSLRGPDGLLLYLTSWQMDPYFPATHIHFLLGRLGC